MKQTSEDSSEKTDGAPPGERPATPSTGGNEPVRSVATSWRARLDGRTIGIGLVSLAGIATFLGVVHGFYPVQHWLFWRYAGAAFAASAWGVACLAAGHRTLRWVLRVPLRFADEIALAFPLGVAIFGYGIFLLGLAHALGWVTFVLLPLAMLLSGRPLYRSVRRFSSHLRHRGMTQRVPTRWLALAAAATVGFLFIYYPLLAPRTFNHDARWYHLAMSEHYAAMGAVARFPEGWFLGAYPQLASYVYTWPFLCPNIAVFDRLEYCAHVELVVVVFILAAIPSLVRVLLHGQRASASFLCFFLFPCVYLYDSNLNVGADHFAAVFAVPVALCLVRFLPRFDLRWGALLAAYMSAALVTKYSAVSLVAFPIAAIFVRAPFLLVKGLRARSFDWVRGFATVALLGVALTSMHWLKNWIWYGDPMYPELRNIFSVHPWVAEAEGTYSRFMDILAHPRPGMAGVLDGLLATITFSFIPNDWPVFHRNWPTYGSLFTLTLPFLPFLRRSGRLALASLATMVAIFVWYLVTPRDRYLQAVFPWMVSATAASLIAAWKVVAWPARVPIAGLVGLQVIWGGDVPFFPTHNLINDSMLRHVSDFLASGYQKRKPPAPYEPWISIGVALPKDARLLIHEVPMHLGTMHAKVQDLWVGGISYVELATPAAVYDKLREYGATHLVTYTARALGDLPVGSDLVFFEFVAHFATHREKFDELTLAELPAARPADSPRARQVAVYSCGGQYEPGWYALSSMVVSASRPSGPPPRESLPRSAYDVPRLLTAADFIIHDATCQAALPAPITIAFERIASRGNNEYWVRR
jgi:hypothetical protein